MLTLEQKIENRKLACKKYYFTHKEQAKEYGNKIRGEFPELNKERHRRYYQEHRKEMYAKSRVWFRNHPELAREYVKTYRNRNPERVKLTDAVCYARRRSSGGKDISKETLKKLQELSGGTCPYCNKTIDRGHLDHIIPISKGGDSNMDNLIWVCNSCNLHKRNRDLGVFLAELWNLDSTLFVQEGGL